MSSYQSNMFTDKSFLPAPSLQTSRSPSVFSQSITDKIEEGGKGSKNPWLTLRPYSQSILTVIENAKSRQRAEILCTYPIIIFPEGPSYIEKAKTYIWQYVDSEETFLTEADLSTIEGHIGDLAMIVSMLCIISLVFYFQLL